MATTPSASVVQFNPTPEAIVFWAGVAVVPALIAKALGASLLVSIGVGIVALGAIGYVAYDISKGMT